MTKKDDPKQGTQKRTMMSQSDLPRYDLASSLRIAQAIWDNYAGKPVAPHEVALALNMSPTSGSWRNLCGSSTGYGLTEGGYNASQISLSALGRRIVAPTVEGDEVRARVEALLKPTILREFFARYNKAKFPREDIAKNVLVGLGVPKERAENTYKMLFESGRATGIIRETKTGPFVAIDSPVPPVTEIESLGPDVQDMDDAIRGDDLDADTEGPIYAPISARAQTGGRTEAPRQLFVAHGKNRKPLEDLKKILNEFKIPFKVAVDEANAGRPISAKVAELMKECSAGVFIFTRDEKLFRNTKNEEKEEVWRPSENVVYELGAASILWERKIIILREEGVNFPSDFSDLGYITFKDGELAHKALDLLKELVALGLVKFQAA